MLAVSVFALLSERSRWALPRAEPELVEPAVEALLRCLSIVQLGTVARTATADVARGDVVVQAG